ncbi:hypothetical protein K491DRAFT_698769 [Lophiostoma macrostomum CBS 122681]|uniref:Uncharacterized protein n=1 Tax=Lophiostoma macrostomum CBS 122681 TaxID=1314788 RepID=A0A6A6SL63_9PLEO|nr:hypothetical protein K491DRAFT_698769 [Lophiostoma macrostomum CBS 122681]
MAGASSSAMPPTPSPEAYTSKQEQDVDHGKDNVLNKLGHLENRISELDDRMTYRTSGTLEWVGKMSRTQNADQTRVEELAKLESRLQALETQYADQGRRLERAEAELKRRNDRSDVRMEIGIAPRVQIANDSQHVLALNEDANGTEGGAHEDSQNQVCDARDMLRNDGMDEHVDGDSLENSIVDDKDALPPRTTPQKANPNSRSRGNNSSALANDSREIGASSTSRKRRRTNSVVETPRPPPQVVGRFQPRTPKTATRPSLSGPFGSATSGKAFTAWLTSLTKPHLSRPFVYDKCIRYERAADREKDKQLDKYDSTTKDCKKNDVLNELGEKAPVRVLKGGTRDADDFSTSWAFTKLKVESNIRIALFHHTYRSKALPYGCFDDDEDPKPKEVERPLWKHAWVGIMAKTVQGPKIAMIYDSSVSDWPDTETGENGENGQDRAKTCRSTLNFLQERFLTDSGVQTEHIYLRLLDRLHESPVCVEASCDFLQEFIAKGDSPIDLGVDRKGMPKDERMAKLDLLDPA